MGARLALSLVSLGIAIALDAVGVGYRFAQPRGLWGTVGGMLIAMYLPIFKIADTIG